MVTIIKDTSPGVLFRHSYDKVGRVTNVVNNEGRLNTYTVKILFENYSEVVDELWLQKYDPETTAYLQPQSSSRITSKRIKDKNVIIADLRGKLRIERRRSRGARLNLEKSDNIIEALARQNENMAEQISTFLCSDIVNGNVIRNQKKQSNPTYDGSNFCVH